MAVTEQRKGRVRLRAMGDQEGTAPDGIGQRPATEAERLERRNHFIGKVGDERPGRIGFLALARAGDAPREDALEFTAVEIDGSVVDSLLATHGWFSSE